MADENPVVSHLSTKHGWSVDTAVDYLLAAIAANAKLTNQQLETERQLREAGTAALAKALELDSTETKRRLDELNHAHATAMENWRTSLPRELFEEWKSEHVRWKDEVTAALTKFVTPAAVDRVDARLTNVESQINIRLKAIEDARNKFAGAIMLLGAAGMAGVIALILGIARLAGVLE